MLNWVLPIVVIIIILTGGFIEGLIILTAYLIYRFYYERDKFFSYIGKRKYFNGKLEKAVQYYEKACRVSRVETKVKASYAYSLILTGRFQKAREILAEIKNHHEAEKVEMQVRVCESVLLWKEENSLRQAITRLEKLEEPLRTSTYYGVLGKMIIATGDMTRARKFSEEAYRYNSKHADILENLITVYCMEERFDRAMKVAEALLKKNPHTTDAYYYCGLAHEKNGKVKKARRLYKKALECDESIISNISHKDITI